MTTITHNSTTITPLLVLGWESAQETRNVVHEIIGKSSPDVTLRSAKSRTGTLHTLWDNAADAETCRALHAQEGTFTLASDEIAQLDMTYVVSGAITVLLDEESRALWTVDVDFIEVTT